MRLDDDEIARKLIRHLIAQADRELRKSSSTQARSSAALSCSRRVARGAARSAAARYFAAR